MGVAASLAGGLRSLSAGLNRACWAAGVLFLLLMLAAVGLQVITRYLLFSPPAWTEELARYAMVWAGYLGATVAFYRGADPVLATPARHSSAGGKLSSLLRSAAMLLFLIPVLYFSPVLLSHHLLRETESLKLVSAYVFAIVPIFSAVVVIHVAARLAHTLTSDTAAGNGEQAT